MSMKSENNGILSSNHNSPGRPAKKLVKNQSFKKSKNPKSYYFTVPSSIVPFCKDQNNHPTEIHLPAEDTHRNAQAT